MNLNPMTIGVSEAVGIILWLDDDLDDMWFAFQDTQKRNIMTSESAVLVLNTLLIWMWVQVSRIADIKVSLADGVWTVHKENVNITNRSYRIDATIGGPHHVMDYLLKTWEYYNAPRDSLWLKSKFPNGQGVFRYRDKIVHYDGTEDVTDFAVSFADGLSDDTCEVIWSL